MKEKNINNIVKKVNTLISNNHYSEAIIYLEDLDKSLKDNYFIKMNLGACYKKTENFDKAMDTYQSAMELPERDSDLYFNIGNLYFAKNEYKESIAFFDLAINDNINHSSSYMRKAISLFLLNKYEESYTILINFYDQFSNDFEVNWTIAANLMFLKRFKDTLPYIDKCLIQQPNNQALRSIMSIVYSHLGKQNEAEESYILGNGVIVFHDGIKDFEVINNLQSKG